MFELFLDSPYRTAISGAVLKLQEEGKLHILKTKWWKEKRGGGSCRVSKGKMASLTTRSSRSFAQRCLTTTRGFRTFFLFNKWPPFIQWPSAITQTQKLWLKSFFTKKTTSFKNYAIKWKIANFWFRCFGSFVFPFFAYFILNIKNTAKLRTSFFEVA